MIALARLGYKTGWISRLGNDEFGRYIRYALQGEGIDLSQVTTDELLPTGILFKEQYHNPNPNVYYYRKNAAVTAITAQLINPDYLAQAKILHLTGITPALSAGAREAVFEAIRIAREHSMMVSFDPNLRLKLWDADIARETLLEMACYADIIFPGDDEAEFLLGTRDHYEICCQFHALGCKIVVLKLGKDGCLISDGKEFVRVDGYHVHHLVDTVGAGDGFAAGFLAGVLEQKTLRECGELANGVGAMATLVRGDSEGYPTMTQLLEFIGKQRAIER
jgi:2-dehydro-3-deoxygluconokinase